MTIRATDRAASERFYGTVLGAVGIESTHTGAAFAEWNDFSLAAASSECPPTRRLHIGFGVPSRAHVDEFWRAGTAAGYRDDGAPGPRPQYTPAYYGSFLLDPDGNSAEAVHHEHLRRDGIVDHLWIRVEDLDASRRFYELIAPHAGLRMNRNTPERVQFAGGGGSFSLLPGEPTEHVHLAFPVTSNESVDAFHRAALDAGYEDNGAYVLGPAGFNIELVTHRPRRAG